MSVKKARLKICLKNSMLLKILDLFVFVSNFKIMIRTIYKQA